MGNAISSISLNNLEYNLYLDNGSLVLLVSEIQQKLIKLEAALYSINVNIPVDGTINKNSENAISNKAVTDQLSSLKSRISVLESFHSLVNMGDYATSDQVISLIADAEKPIDTYLSTTSTNAVQNLAITKELKTLYNQLTSVSTALLSCATKDDIKDVEVDGTLSLSSKNPVLNSVVSKEINNLKLQVGQLEGFGENSTNLTFKDGTLFINGVAAVTISQNSSATSITLLNLKTYAIPHGSDATASTGLTTTVTYNQTTGAADIVFGTDSGASYDSASKTLTLT